jgi:dCMP deaminase
MKHRLLNMESGKRDSTWWPRYLGIARQVSTWSKDPSTQVGAIAVGTKGQILAQGYNGYPRGMDDSDYDNREEKYKKIVHAEMNCIYNASWNGVSLDGADLFVYGLPVCHECAKAIIQVGIKRVISPWMQNLPKKWDDSFELTNKFFKEAGVKYELVKYD